MDSGINDTESNDGGRFSKAGVVELFAGLILGSVLGNVLAGMLFFSVEDLPVIICGLIFFGCTISGAILGGLIGHRCRRWPAGRKGDLQIKG